MTFVRRWGPVAAVLLLSLSIQKIVFEPRYDVSGHAGEHLASASTPFFAVVLITLLFTATPAARKPLAMATGAAWLAATMLVMVGNVRVVDALVSAGFSDTPTSQLQAAGVDVPHGLANLAPWLGVAAALILVGVFAYQQHVSRNVAVAGVVLSVLFPPWILPGAGVLVIAVARVNTRIRSQTPAHPQPVPRIDH